MELAPSRRTAFPTPPPDPARSALARLVDQLGQRGTAAHSKTGRLACWQPSGILCSRRWHRVPWRTPLLLTPWDDATGEPLASPVEVIGRDLSVSGTSFEHADPLHSRQVMLRSLDTSAELLAFVVTLRWCRFTRAGIYQSGGRFESVTLLPRA